MTKEKTINMDEAFYVLSKWCRYEGEVHDFFDSCSSTIDFTVKQYINYLLYDEDDFYQETVKCLKTEDKEELYKTLSEIAYQDKKGYEALRKKMVTALHYYNN